VKPRDERWIEFAVIDRGPGVSVAVAEQLFTPFFTTKAEGMGIGLSMCRTVVEQHGGALDFVPTPGGRGATFRFTLAAAGPATIPAAAQPVESALP
jgi:two-component system sensor histidine kinase DctS